MAQSQVVDAARAAAQLQSTKAKARRASSPSASGKLGSFTRGALASGVLMAAGPTVPQNTNGYSSSPEQAAAQLHNNQQQASIQQANSQIPTFLPSLQPAADRGLIDDEQFDQARIQAQSLQQQIQAVTSLAQLSGLRQQMQAMENKFSELLFDQDRLEEINEIRRNIWRSIRTSLEGLDEATGGSTMGFGMMASTVISIIQFAKGIEYRGDNKEPPKITTLFTPPPMDLITSDNDKGKILNTILSWMDRFDLMFKFLQISMVITVFFLAMILLFIITAIVTDPISAALDSNLRGFAEALGLTITDVVTETVK